MLHSQIEIEEVVERYVRNRLAPEERQAFEEHFFGCEECFEKLQAAERFFAGLSDAAEAVLLSGGPDTATTSPGSVWSIWALAAATCASLVFAAATGWMYLVQAPKLRNQLDQAKAQLATERQQHAPDKQTSIPVEQAEANVPLVTLQASRADEEPTTAILRPGAKRLILWIELGSSRYRKFRLEVFSHQNHLVASLSGLEQGPYHALAASLPADQLPTGDFRITLNGQEPPPASLVGEYHLRIRRPQ